MQLTKTALIAALLFAPVAFAQVQLTSGTGGGVNLGIAGPQGVPGIPCSLTSPPATCDLGTNTLLAAILSGATSVQSGNVVGSLNASVCALSNKPSWCAGSDPGAWHNAAVAQIPLTNGLPHGIVTFDPTIAGTTANYTVTSTIHVLNGETLDCKGGYLYWPQRFGVMLQVGSVSAGTSATVETTIKNCIFVGPEYLPQSGSQYVAADTSIGTAIGGDPASLWNNVIAGVDQGAGTAIGTSAGGTGVRFENVVFAGFHAGIQGGNSFHNDTFTNVYMFRNYNAIADTACQTGGFSSGESLSWFGGQMWGQWGNTVRMDCGNQWYFHSGQFDYGNAAGLATAPNWGGSSANGIRAANAEVYGKNVWMQCDGCHFEHDSGPMVATYETSAVNSNFIMNGGEIVLSAPNAATAALTACSSNGAVVTLTGTFPSSMTSLLSGTGLTLSMSGFTGSCASLNGLTLTSCGNGAATGCASLTSTTFTALSSATANGTDAGTATVPAEAGVMFPNQTGSGQQQFRVNWPYIIANVGGASFNSLTSFVDTSTTSNSLTLTCLNGVGGTHMPSIGTCSDIGFGNTQDLVQGKSKNFSQAFIANPTSATVLVKAGTGTTGKGSVAQEWYYSTEANPILAAERDQTSGNTEIAFGPGGSTALDTILARTGAFQLQAVGSSLTGSALRAVGVGTGTYAELIARFTCDASHTGLSAYVTDSTVKSQGATVAGSGSFNVPVHCYNSTWIVGSPVGSPIRAGAWTITNPATTAAVTFSTAMSVAPASCTAQASSSTAATGNAFPTALATSGFTVNVTTTPASSISGTYQCVNANTF